MTMQTPSDLGSAPLGGLRGPAPIRAKVGPRMPVVPNCFSRPQFPNPPAIFPPRPNWIDPSNPLWRNPPPPAHNWAYMYPGGRPPLPNINIPPPPIPGVNFEPVASSQWNESQWPPPPAAAPWSNTNSYRPYYQPSWNPSPCGWTGKPPAASSVVNKTLPTAPSQVLPWKPDHGISPPKSQLSTTTELGNKASVKLPTLETHGRHRKHEHQRLSKVSRSSSRESLRSRRLSYSKDRSRRQSPNKKNRAKCHLSRESRPNRSSGSRSPSRSRSRSPIRNKEHCSSRMSSRKRGLSRSKSRSPSCSKECCSSRMSSRKVSPSRSRSRSPSCSKGRSSSRMSRRKRRSSSRERSRSKQRKSRERLSSEKMRSVVHLVPETDNSNSRKLETQKKLTNFISEPLYSQSNLDTNSSTTIKEDNFKSTLRSDSRLSNKVDSESVVDLDKELEDENSVWTRCSPADLYYQRSLTNPAVMVGTPKLVALLDRFNSELVERANKVRNSKPKYEPPARKLKMILPEVNGSDEESNGEETDEDSALKELEHKRKHPDRLHEELWYNDAGEMNDGPLCKCSVRASNSGIRHGIYSGEDHLEPCDPNSNNADRLYHYRITMSPHTNFLTKAPTVIRHDGHEFIFEGFSMFSHYPLVKLPTCKVIRFNIDYTVHYIEEKFPDNFTIRGIELFCDYLLREILELLDLDLRAWNDPDGCKRFHFLPRFARALDDNGKEILSMNEVISYLLMSSKPLVEESDIPVFMKMNQYEWQNFADEVKGMIVTYPGMKPCSLRVDQLDRDMADVAALNHPDIVHFGIRPLQLSYAGNPNYQKAWREYVKFRHLLANKPKVTYQDRHKLMQKELRLQEMRTKCTLKRDVTVVVSSKGFYRTGIMCDIVQHAMLLPVLICHLRFHKSLDTLEECLGHKFKDRYLLQLALTHPSYRENYGTNPDHARNSLTNCGIRQPEYGDRRIHYVHTRKRGITTLINIMSRFGKPEVSMSNISHNERLEFLGDAVVEFLTSIHLFHLFPEIEEGGLATYRAAIVQNQHLAVLAKRLELDKFMLYAHGSDLCHDLELRHAMANCFEALMGALFLDSGVEIVDRIFSETLFHSSMENSKELLDTWVNYPRHPIQEQEPDGDRQWIESVPLLKKLTKFEEEIGVEFKHIRLLARAFTHRSVGYNNLTLGSNQRLEFLGDTVLQLVASEHLFKFFPEHHEGHLSLLRSSLVNNRTQSVVCNDLGMVDYAIYAYPKDILRAKDRADLLEAVLGALYVDKGVDYCRVFCQVCFFPRLQDFIMNQDWNDPKSKLQQCCLTLRTMDGGEPDIPIYKVIECKGPTNTRTFTVAVYFRGERLAQGRGHSIQQAEMQAAKLALASSKAELFPQLQYQKRVIERSIHLRQLEME